MTPDSEIDTPSTATTASAPRAERQVATSTRATERRPVRRPERKPERKSVAARVDTPRPDPDRAARTEATAAKSEKKTARSMQDVKSEASGLYRARNFNGASSVVSQSLSSFSGADAQELKSLASSYLQFGKAFNVGMAPATRYTDGYVQLRRAQFFDKDLGKVFLPEIEERLVVVATRAAMQYMATKDYEPAFRAVQVSEQLGGNSSSNRLIREKLESVAADLLRSATSEVSSNPEEAKRKARQVVGLVDTKHPLHARATKLLNGP